MLGDVFGEGVFWPSLPGPAHPVVQEKPSITRYERKAFQDNSWVPKMLSLPFSLRTLVLWASGGGNGSQKCPWQKDWLDQFG